MKKHIFGILFLLISCTNYLAAQVDTEFWFAAPFFNCGHGSNAPYRLVIFSFDEEATVTVSMPANPEFTPIVRTISAHSYTEIVLANNKEEGDAVITTPFNTITQRGLLITSTGKIECYYQVEGDNSEAYTLKGKNALGTDFLVVGQKTYDNGTGGDQEGSRFSMHIVASEDNTEVTINPSNSILLSDGSSSSAPVTIVLNKGETYAVASYEGYAALNLAGSTIKSNKPIAVTVNDDSVTPNNWNADAVGEQLIPTDFAGTSFVIISGGNSYDICTVFALYNNTTVTISALGYSSQTFTINKGGYETISMNGIQALSITTSEPIMVFQTLSAVQGGGEFGGTVLPHVKCTGSGVVGYKSFSTEYISYINLITEKKNISNFTIDGVPVAASAFQAVDESDNYYYAAIPKSYSPTPYIISCLDGFFQMGVTEGGNDGSNTYGFFSNYGAAYKGDEYDSFQEGMTYTWLNHYMKDGVTPITFTAEGEYRDTLIAADGCDSVCTLHLKVNPKPYGDTDILVHTQCADDPYLEFDVTALDGLCHQLQFVFGPKAIAQHFRDTIVDYSSQILIPNSARAGIYEVAVSLLDNNQVLDTRNVQFTLLYPSSVLDQHWDDFIGVLTHNYNGGYDFVGFQWYKNGQPMAGENHSYTYQPLEMGAAYSAMLEEADGTKLMTCEIIATSQTEISIYPTLLQPHQIMRLHSTTDVTIWLYDNLGKMIYTNSFDPGDHQLAAPQAPGVYVIRIQQDGTSGKTDTKKLIVR